MTQDIRKRGGREILQNISDPDVFFCTFVLQDRISSGEML